MEEIFSIFDSEKKGRIFFFGLPGDASVNRSSLSERVGDFLAAIGIGGDDGFAFVVVNGDVEGQAVGGGGAVGVGDELAARLDRRLGLTGEGRVVGVGGEGLETDDALQILILAAAAEVGGVGFRVVVVVVVDVGEGGVLGLRRVAAAGEEVLQLRRRVLHVAGVDGGLLGLVVVVVRLRVHRRGRCESGSDPSRE